MLDGVPERRNYLVEISGQLAAAPDHRPERDGRRSDRDPGDGDGVEIVMKVWSKATMSRITGLSNARTAFLPSTRATDILRALVSEKHIGAPIVTLGVSLKPPSVPGQHGEVRFVDGHQQDV